MPLSTTVTTSQWLALKITLAQPKQLLSSNSSKPNLCIGCILCVQTAKDVVAKVVQELGRVDVLVNNASEQRMSDDLTDVTPEELERTFRTNVFSYFYFAQVRTRACVAAQTAS